jgi:hypothetical protein
VAVDAPDSQSPTPAAAVGSAVAPVAVALGCAASPAGGVLVGSGQSAPYGQAIAAGPGGVLVTWMESLSGTSCRGGDTCIPIDGHARVLDATLLSADAGAGLPPVRLSQGTVVEDHSGFPPVALANGGLYGASCKGSVVASSVECIFTRAAGPVMADASWSFHAHNSVLTIARGAATGVGGAALLIVPTLGEMYFFASGTHAHREFIAEVGASGADRNQAAVSVAWIDAPAIAAAGADQAVAVWRASPGRGQTDGDYIAPAVPGVPGAIRARLVGTDGHGRGHVVVLSAPGDDVGAPAVAWVGGAADVVYAHRRAHGEPWHLVLARWTPGSPPVRTEITTGAAPAVAPAIVGEPGPSGCAIVSWTEGEGHGTAARAGRLCPSATTPSDVEQLSRAAIEAGASALATDGTGVFTVWQELPGHGAPAELRAARLSCPPLPDQPFLTSSSSHRWTSFAASAFACCSSACRPATSPPRVA